MTFIRAVLNKFESWEADASRVAGTILAVFVNVGKIVIVKVKLELVFPVSMSCHNCRGIGSGLTLARDTALTLLRVIRDTNFLRL